MSDPKSYRPTNLPNDPGVYRFFDENDKVIYVGKAKNIKNRINSYFGSNLQIKTRRMVNTAVRVDWTVVNTEVEALQLEFTWIKQYSPDFNVQFKDDKSYPYIAVTVSEDFPRIFITRGLKRKGIKYLGPFPNARDLRHVVDHTLRTFPVRTCSNSTFNDARRSNRPCLLGHIQKCSAPCVKMISADDHRILVQDFVGFFSRDPSSYLKKIEKKMYEAAETENFELAAALRDDLQALEGVLEDSSVIQSDDVNADFVALVFGNIEMGASIFSVRQGKIRGQRSVVSDLNHGVDPSDSMK